jgi:hypothetical protein
MDSKQEKKPTVHHKLFTPSMPPLSKEVQRSKDIMACYEHFLTPKNTRYLNASLENILDRIKRLDQLDPSLANDNELNPRSFLRANYRILLALACFKKGQVDFTLELLSCQFEPSYLQNIANEIKQAPNQSAASVQSPMTALEERSFFTKKHPRETLAASFQDHDEVPSV